ncbi:MAG: NAD-dependent epimerase/dehydratase family protein [Prolixibacteraceae bacterium]|nr:NAD-dependent epimerase/dehydratase family protein [Prolixibacteraceae bacterium]
MKVLFIGGSGVISSACTQLAVDKGIELFHLNRGKTSDIRPVPGEVIQIEADVRNFEKTSKAIEGHAFDVVADWISFMPEHIENNLKLFKGKAKQYLFISSASAYQTPPLKLPVTEETPLENPYWKYSRDKIACETFLKDEAEKYGMKYTIVRPSHTYDKTLLPFDEGYTVVDRMLNGKPVVVLGDGTSIWTLTHHRDFAKGLVGLLNNPKAMNEKFHITSDEWLTWNQIYTLVGQAFGVTPRLVHVPSEIIASYNEELGAGLLGDKSHSMIFDNSKIKSAVPEFECTIPFSEGVKEIADWYKSDKATKETDLELDRIFDALSEKIVSIYNA